MVFNVWCKCLEFVYLVFLRTNILSHDELRRHSIGKCYANTRASIQSSAKSSLKTGDIVFGKTQSLGIILE